MSKIDIFISYNWNEKPKVEQLENKLKSVGLSVWRDDSALSYSKSLPNQLARAILDSKLVLVCLTKEYTNSDNCIKEITYANISKKPMSILMIDHMTPSEMGGVGFLISTFIRVNCYKNPSNWLDANFNEIIRSIEDNINIKINQICLKPTVEVSESLIEPNLERVKGQLKNPTTASDYNY